MQQGAGNVPDPPLSFGSSRNQQVDTHARDRESGDADHFVHMHGKRPHARWNRGGESRRPLLSARGLVVERSILVDRRGHAAVNDVFLLEDGSGGGVRYSCVVTSLFLNQGAQFQIPAMRPNTLRSGRFG